MGALEDVAVLESWSPLHKRIEVIDRYPDGRAHHVKTTIRIMGLVDKEVLEYHWGPDWVVYDAKGTSQQHGQHVEYNLKPEGVDNSAPAYLNAIAKIETTLSATDLLARLGEKKMPIPSPLRMITRANTG